MKKKLTKVLNIIVNILIVMIFVISVFVLSVTLTTKSQGVPNLFGYAPMTVISDSMEPTYEVGDLIIGEVVEPGDTFEVGDIVTFQQEINGQIALNTHRIVEIEERDGKTYYTTKGDNSLAPVDEDVKTDVDLVAKCTETRKVSGLGNVFTFITSSMGFFVCILLPMILFFIYEAVRVVINVVAYNKEKAVSAAMDAVANAELTEEQKQKAIAEYLASLNAQNNETPESEQTPADSKQDSQETPDEPHQEAEEEPVVSEEPQDSPVES